MTSLSTLPRYDRLQSYQWNYDHAPDPVALEVPALPGDWDFCGLPVASPLGVPAGPLLNGRWILFYAALGFDVLTYKTVRSVSRECYPLPNLVPVRTGSLQGTETDVLADETMHGSWAVSFGMPSKEPAVWREDVTRTRKRLGSGKVLSVSVVATVQPGWTLNDVANDYAQCARWALDAGADCIEANFSCPNVSTCDGQLYQHPADAAVVAARIREVIGDCPLIAKIGHVTDAAAADELLTALVPSVSALAMTNSVATVVKSATSEIYFSGERRGICGKATFDASLGQVKSFAKLIAERNFSCRLIGVGGADSAESVAAYLAAGAHAVHIATAAMENPRLALEIRERWVGQ